MIRTLTQAVKLCQFLYSILAYVLKRLITHFLYIAINLDAQSCIFKNFFFLSFFLPGFNCIEFQQRKTPPFPIILDESNTHAPDEAKELTVSDRFEKHLEHVHDPALLSNVTSTSTHRRALEP
jgi:hypothetical protein